MGTNARRFLFRCPLAAAIALLASVRVLAAPWVAITELHIHPLEGRHVQFIEILNREPPRLDLTGWSLEGKVSFQFPAGTVLMPGAMLVVAADPDALRKQRSVRAEIVGPFQGDLAAPSGRVALRSAAGAVAAEVRVRSGAAWPAAAFGGGHSLSLVDPLFDPNDGSSWRPSPEIGGSPGEPNFVRVTPPGAAVVARAAAWRLFKGRAAPGSSWMLPEFVDSDWIEIAAPLGYGDGAASSELADMRGGYLSVFLRHTFVANDGAPGRHAVLRLDFDDAFVAFLDGVEIGRSNLGDAPTIPHTANARANHEAGAPLELDLGEAAQRLAAGPHLLAVQVHNRNLTSSDLFFACELELRDPDAIDPQLEASLRINEIVSGPNGFIELVNLSTRRASLAGHHLMDDLRSPAVYTFPKETWIAPNGFVVVESGNLPAPLLPALAKRRWLLARPDRQAVVDLVPAVSGEAGAVRRGRLPESGNELVETDEPTPLAANRVSLERDLVINEIHYHALEDSPAEEFVEIHNRGASETALAGFKLSGGVDFAFPESTTIASKGFLVVALDPATLAKAHGLDPSAALGPWRGALSNRGEELRLLDPRGRAIDRVRFGDRDPWPRWADGLGSTLELTDPDLDNSLAGAWAPSDERESAQWRSYEYEGRVHDFQGQRIAEFQVMLLDTGECLVDDIEVEGLFRDDFESGKRNWQFIGTHERSSITVEPGTKNRCLHLVADGRGNSRTNSVIRPLQDLSRIGDSLRVRFRARWQRGTPVLLTRMPGQGAALTHRLEPPVRRGTPGRANSTGNAAPTVVVGTPRQDPIAPAPNRPVRIEVAVTSRETIQSVTAHWRRDGQQTWRDAPLTETPDDDGPRAPSDARRFSGEIPGQLAGVIEFFIEAKDRNGKSGAYPPQVPAPTGERTALYLVGLRPSSKYPTYTVLSPQREWQAMERRPRMSNQLAPCTVIYNDTRIFHQAGFRHRGSPFTRSDRNWRVVFGADSLGGRKSLTLDGQQSDGTRLNERLTFWLLDQLHVPTPRVGYVALRLPGREDAVFEDVEKVDGDFASRWFEPRAVPLHKRGETAVAGEGDPSTKAAPPESDERDLLHKIDDHWEIVARGGRTYREAQFQIDEAEPEFYRWNFPPRAGTPLDSMQPVYELIQLMDPQRTPNDDFDTKCETLIDSEQWIRSIAARAMVDDWDTMGRARGKNAFIFRSRRDGRWRLLPWDADLSWRDPYSPLITGRFPAIDRLLQRPGNYRRYLACLGFLAQRRFSANFFEEILSDFRRRTGTNTQHFASFAEQRSRMIRNEVPEFQVSVQESKRVVRPGEADLLRVRGVAPPMAIFFTLGHRAGAVRLSGEEGFEADFAVGPEGGATPLLALDFGGYELSRTAVSIPERRGAPPMPEQSIVAPTPKAAKRKVAHPEAAPRPAQVAAAAPVKAPPAEAKARPAAQPTDGWWQILVGLFKLTAAIAVAVIITRAVRRRR